MKIIGTGLSGIIGSRVVELLSPRHDFENLSLEAGVDITDYATVNRKITTSDAELIFHFAAYTDVQAAEMQKEQGKKGLAWKVNVEATENIVNIARQTAKKIVYIDTDYAFDGKKQEYTEDDQPNPLSWYASTKLEGTKRVLSLGKRALIIRIANPYRANPVGKKDFVHKMLDFLYQGQPIVAVTDQLFVPTYIDDIAEALESLIGYNASGLYHVVGNTALSPYEAALTIADVWGLDNSRVKKATFAEFFAGRAPIPQYAALKNDKLRSLGISMHSFKDGLQEMKKIEYNKHL